MHREMVAADLGDRRLELLQFMERIPYTPWDIRERIEEIVREHKLAMEHELGPWVKLLGTFPNPMARRP